MKDLSQVRLADLWREVKITEEEIWGDLKLETKLHLKKLIEGCLISEQEMALKAPHHARYKARIDYRNGYYFCSLETTLETIGDLKVPRNRLASLESRIFKKYQRKEVKLVELIKDCFLASKSTKIPESRVTKIPDPKTKKLFIFTSSFFNIFCPVAWTINLDNSRIMDNPVNYC